MGADIIARGMAKNNGILIDALTAQWKAVVRLTQAQYTALSIKDVNTLYIIVEE